MKLTSHDWKILQLPLIAFGFVVIVVLALISYTGDKKDQALAKLESQKSQLNQARQRFQTSGAEKETIVKYMPLYFDLVRRGFIGEERRIEWIDNLRTINQQYKLFGIHYSIGTQEIYKPLFQVDIGPFTLHHSLMRIETPLLHEGDMLTIFKALENRQSSPFMPSDCEINRLPGTTKNKFVPNLGASCEIEWLTISEPARNGTKP